MLLNTPRGYPGIRPTPGNNKQKIKGVGLWAVVQVAAIMRLYVTSPRYAAGFPLQSASPWAEVHTCAQPPHISVIPPAPLIRGDPRDPPGKQTPKQKPPGK